MSRDIKAGGAYVELLLKSQSFVAGLKSASSRLRSFGDSAKRIGSLGFLGGGGGGGIARLFAGAGAAAALAYPIKLASNLEVAEAQFRALTGSAEKASAIIAGIEQFSATALIPVDELQRTSQLLLGYGLAAEQVIPAVKALAEISRGNAERFNLLALAFGQTTAKTRLYAAEVRQFVESGFNPLQQIAQTTGETMAAVSKRLEAGGISAAELTAALQAAVGPGGRFNGLLDAMGKTASGAFSRLLTGVKLAIRPLGQELLPAIRGVVEKANEWIPAFSKIVKENAKIATVVGLAVVSFVGAAAAITSFGLAVQVAGFGLAGVAAALSLVLNPITLVAGAVAGLGYWFATSTEWGRTMVTSLAGWFGKLKDVVSDAFAGIADALASGDLALAGKIAMSALQIVFLQGVNAIQNTWSQLAQSVMSILDGLALSWNAVWAGMVIAASHTWGVVERGWIDISAFFGNSLDMIALTFTNTWTRIKFASAMAFNDILAAFQTMYWTIRSYSWDFLSDLQWKFDNIASERAAANGKLLKDGSDAVRENREEGLRRFQEREAQAEAARNRSRQTDAGVVGGMGGALADAARERQRRDQERQSAFAADQRRQEAALQQAKAELAAARETAMKNRQMAGMGADGAPAFDPAKFALNAASLKDDIFGSFSGAALAAQGGAGGNLQQKMLDNDKQAAAQQAKRDAQLLAAVKAGGVVGP